MNLARPLLALLALAALPGLGRAQAPFSDGTLAVVTVGDFGSVLPTGTQARLASDAKRGGVLLTPTPTALPVFLSQNALEGTLACDGTVPFRMSLAGYESPSGGSVAADSSIRRRVVQFDARTLGTTVSDLGPGDYVGARIHSAQIVGSRLITGGAYSTANPAFSGAIAGTYAPGGASLTQPLFFPPDNATPMRQVQEWGGATYASYGDTIRVIANGQSVQTISGLLMPSDFVLDGNAMYIADATTGGLGGLYRATRTNGTWGAATRVGNLPVLAHLAYDGVRLYATTNTGGAASLDNALLTIDPFGGSSVTLATAGTNRSFRGVQSVLEPASLAILGLGALGVLRRRRRSD